MLKLENKKVAAAIILSGAFLSIFALGGAFTEDKNETVVKIHEPIKVKSVNDEVDIEPIKVTINDIKVVEVRETNKEDWHYIQITCHSESSIDKTIDWDGITSIITDKGEEIDVIEQDFAYTDNVGTIHELGVERNHVIMVKVKDPKIDSIELVLGEITERDSDKPNLSNGTSIEYNLN